MTTIGEIQELLSSNSHKNKTVEFKESGILTTSSGKKKLAHEMIAFANLNGGKIFIGITDLKEFEGIKIVDMERYKGQINNICKTNISPPLDFSFETLKLNGDNVLIINIFKKKDIPHAFVKMSNGEIIERTYYIRTDYGKRLVTDNELQWLFLERRTDKCFTWRSILFFTFSEMRFLLEYKNPKCQEEYEHLLYKIFFYYKDEISENKIKQLIIQMSPYAFLFGISKFLKDGWLVNINNVLNEENIDVHNMENITGELVKNENIPHPPKKSLLSNIMPSLAFYKEFNNFFLPPYTRIKIEYDQSRLKSKLILINPDFTFTFSFILINSGLKIKGEIPYDEVINKPFFQELLKYRMEMGDTNEVLHFYDLECKMKVKYSFPDKNFMLMNYYYVFEKVIREIITNRWDYFIGINKSAQERIFILEDKVDRILENIKK